MPNDDLSEAIKEAYAHTSHNNVTINTLELRHPNISGGALYLVQNPIALNLTLETGQVIQFNPAGFDFSLPSVSEDGVNEINISIDNVGVEVMRLVNAVVDSRKALSVSYRPYLEGFPDAPELVTPYVFTMSNLVVTELTVQGRAVLRDMVNKPFPSVYYTRTRFPSLGD